MEWNRELDKLNQMMWGILKNNERLEKKSMDSFDENPDNLCPSPRVCKIIDTYADEKNRALYKEIVAKWKTGEMTLNEERKYDYVIKFVRDWYSVLSSDYQSQYCYGYLSAMMECLERSSKLDLPDEYRKAIFETYGFTAEYGEKVAADWDKIECQRQKVIEEGRRNAERIAKEREELKKYWEEHPATE